MSFYMTYNYFNAEPHPLTKIKLVGHEGSGPS